MTRFSHVTIGGGIGWTLIQFLGGAGFNGTLVLIGAEPNSHWLTSVPVSHFDARLSCILISEITCLSKMFVQS